MSRSCISVVVEASAVGKILTILTSAIEQGVPCTISSVKSLKSDPQNTTKASTKSNLKLRFKRKVDLPETKLCRSSNDVPAPVPMDLSEDGKLLDVPVADLEAKEADSQSDGSCEYIEVSSESSSEDDMDEGLLARGGPASTRN